VPFRPANTTEGSADAEHYLRGAGPRRQYVDLSLPTDPKRDAVLAFPKRPVPGSAADLDIIHDNCDFSRNHVRSRPVPF
jgi:hypothetical protein